MSTDKANRRYPEIVEAGSLKEALDKRLREIDSRLVSSPPSRDEFPLHYARVEWSPRFSQVYLAAEECLFLPDYWDHGVCLAHGQSTDFDGMVSSVDDWVSGSTESILKLSRDYRFVTLNHGAAAHEDGTETEGRWRDYLDGKRLGELHPDLPSLVLAASEQPKIRRLFPYTSMATFHLSRCTGYPYTQDTPWFQPLGNQRFRAIGGSGKIIGEGEAIEVVTLASACIEDSVGKAWRGTATSEPTNRSQH